LYRAGGVAGCYAAGVAASRRSVAACCRWLVMPSFTTLAKCCHCGHAIRRRHCCGHSAAWQRMRNGSLNRHGNVISGYLGHTAIIRHGGQLRGYCHITPWPRHHVCVMWFAGCHRWPMVCPHQARVSSRHRTGQMYRSRLLLRFVAIILPVIVHTSITSIAAYCYTHYGHHIMAQSLLVARPLPGLFTVSAATSMLITQVVRSALVDQFTGVALW